MNFLEGGKRRNSCYSKKRVKKNRSERKRSRKNKKMRRSRRSGKLYRGGSG